MLGNHRHKNNASFDRSHIYSSRPPSIIGEIITGNMRCVLMPYGAHWRVILLSRAGSSDSQLTRPIGNKKNIQRFTCSKEVRHLYVNSREGSCRYIEIHL
jgi:hypothetical protein